MDQRAFLVADHSVTGDAPGNRPLPSPRQPNERDESSDSQASAPRDVMRQAASDIERGLKDTDCRNSAGEIVRDRQRDETK